MKRIAITAIIIAVLTLTAILLYNVIQKDSFKVFELPDEPDTIYSSMSTDNLYIIKDGRLKIYDKNGNFQEVPDVDNIRSVFALRDKTWIIDTDSNLLCLETLTGKTEFIMENISEFSAVSDSCAAVTNDGDLYVWGDNSDHMLGVGEKIKTDKPVCVYYLQNVRDIKLGNRYALALDSSGKVYECGILDYEMSEENGSVPVYTSRFQCIEELSNISKIESGMLNMAMTQTRIFFWSMGYLTDNKHLYLHDLNKLSDKCQSEGISDISSGNEFFLGLNSGGDVYYWGKDIINKWTDKGEKWIDEPEKINISDKADAVFAACSVGYVKHGKYITILHKDSNH